MVETKTNKEMAQMLESLYGVIDQKGMLGYAAARNLRSIRNAAREYLDIRDDLMQKYGENELDESGEKTARYLVRTNTALGRKYLEEISRYDEIEHEVEIMKIKPEDAIDQLTGRQMLAIEWMIEGDLQ